MNTVNISPDLYNQKLPQEYSQELDKISVEFNLFKEVAAKQNKEFNDIISNLRSDINPPPKKKIYEATSILNSDVILKVLGNVDLTDIFNMICVCKNWNDVSRNTAMWKNLIKHNRPDIFKLLGKKFPTWELYGRRLASIEVTKIDLFNIRKNQEKNYCLSVCNTLALSVIWLPLCLNSLLYGFEKLNEFQKANITKSAMAYLKDHPDMTIDEAISHIMQQYSDLSDLYS